jgi:hypothetical protein
MMTTAYRCRDPKRAMDMLKKIARQLEHKHPSAAASSLVGRLKWRRRSRNQKEDRHRVSTRGGASPGAAPNAKRTTLRRDLPSR